jgi:hypothetical protein
MCTVTKGGMMSKTQGIPEYVAHTAQLCRDIAPDLCFGEADDHNRIIFKNLQINSRFVRVSGARPGVLHLKWIEVYAQQDRQVTNVAPQGSVSTSSAKPGSEGMIASGRFLQAHSGSFGFHTKTEERPWVCVDLGSAMDLRSIVLVNRADRWASRSAKLDVETSLDGVNWQQIYTHEEAERQLLEVLTRRRNHCDNGLDMPLQQMIDNVIVRALAADYDEANSLLKSTPGYGPETRNQVAHAVTAHVLARRKLEWTNHSVKRTFRYWTDEQKQDYLRFANRLAEEIIALGYDSCIGYGGVLSMVRDRDLIQHDDDLDLIVSMPRQSFSTIGEGLEDLSGKLRDRGYKVGGDYATHRHVSDPSNRAVDLFVGFEEGDFVSWFPGPRRELRKSDVFPGILCSLVGVQCLLPRNPFRYVEAVYGPEWMVPISRWNHTWDRAVYSDWFDAQSDRGADTAKGSRMDAMRRLARGSTR